MNPEFWLDRWNKEEIGWHRDDANPNLTDNWEKLDVSLGQSVLVPLCGKSVDMLWLATKGYQVVGCELSKKAVESFFVEHNMAYETQNLNSHVLYKTQHIKIYCGDFFDLPGNVFTDIRAVYDRASLIALPPAMRLKYVENLKLELPERTQILLSTIDYNPAKMDGPPFAVTRDEVQRLYSGWEINLLSEQDTLDQAPLLEEAGLDWLIERVYRINR